MLCMSPSTRLWKLRGLQGWGKASDGWGRNLRCPEVRWRSWGHATRRRTVWQQDAWSWPPGEHSGARQRCWELAAVFLHDEA